MAKELERNSISDTATYSFEEDWGNSDVKFTLLFTNSHDQSLTVTTYGTRTGDDNNNDIVQLDQQTVAATDGTARFSTSDTWEKIYVEYTAGTGPTGSGEFVAWLMANTNE